MKRFFLLASLACALAGNLKADNPQIIIHSTHAEEDARAAAVLRDEHKTALDNYFRTLAETAMIPHDSQIRGLYQDWLRQNRKTNDEARCILATDQLTDGDPIPSIANLYDDAATIRLYLHDSGYSDLSDAQIAKVRTYMHAHDIRHVSQLSQ